MTAAEIRALRLSLGLTQVDLSRLDPIQRAQIATLRPDVKVEANSCQYESGGLCENRKGIERFKRCTYLWNCKECPDSSFPRAKSKFGGYKD